MSALTLPFSMSRTALITLFASGMMLTACGDSCGENVADNNDDPPVDMGTTTDDGGDVEDDGGDIVDDGGDIVDDGGDVVDMDDGDDGVDEDMGDDMGDEDMADMADMAGGDEFAQIQIMHLAAGAGSVDIYVNDTLLLDDFDEYESTTAFPVAANELVDVDVVAAGDADNSLPLYSVEFEDGLATGENYILAAIGDATADAASPEAFRIEALSGARLSDENGIFTSVTVLHAVYDAPAVDIDIDPFGDNADGPRFDSVPFGGFPMDADGHLAYVDIDATSVVFDDTQIIDIYVDQGTGNDDDDLYLDNFQVGGLGDLGGVAGIVAATGTLTDGDFELRFYPSAPAEMAGEIDIFEGIVLDRAARVQLLHNSPDADLAEVDVYVTSTNFANYLYADNLDYKNTVPVVSVPSGQASAITISAGASTDASAPLLELDELAQREGVIAVINGLSDVDATKNTIGIDYAPILTLLDSDQPIDPNEPGLVGMSFHHGSPDSPPVKVRVKASPAGTPVDIFDTVSFGETSPGDLISQGITDVILEVTTDDGMALYETSTSVDFSVFDVATPVLLVASGSSGSIPNVFDAADLPQPLEVLAVQLDGTVSIIPLVPSTVD